METKPKRVRHAHKPDAQAFDEIRITTVPRFKTSGMSGDEWRISGKIEFMRKGKVIHEERMANVDNCAYSLGHFLMLAKDSGLGFYGGGEDGKCDQEGCAEVATVFYRIKQEYCKTDPFHHPKKELDDEIVLRQFCERHSKRGDSTFDDMDENYELIEGNPKPPQADDESPSAFGGVITLND